MTSILGAFPRFYLLFSTTLLVSFCLFILESRRENEDSRTEQLLRFRRNLATLDSPAHSHSLFTDDEARDNAFKIDQWRRRFHLQCGTSKVNKDEIVSFLRTAFKPSRIKKGTHEDSLPIVRCEYSFIDLGASVGTMLGRLIEAGLPTCETKQMKPPLYDLGSGLAIETSRGSDRSPMVVWLASMLQSVTRYPESYCYFGIEGNPSFTDQLHRLERQVMRSSPRPVRRAHFFTDSVVTDVDGEITTLYLDTINAKQSFWGSSLISTHRDVKPDSNRTATVEGYTLSTLLEHTVMKQSGAHAIIKMDVEGSEYKVFQESLTTLCNFTNSGVRVDLLIALHDSKVLGNDRVAAMELYNANKLKALDCGINLFEGDYEG